MGIGRYVTVPLFLYPTLRCLGNLYLMFTFTEVYVRHRSHMPQNLIIPTVLYWTVLSGLV